MTLLKQIEITVQIQESNSSDTFILAEEGGTYFNLELYLALRDMISLFKTLPRPQIFEYIHVSVFPFSRKHLKQCKN